MARKLIVLYDGTWNTPEDQTNVARSHVCAPPEAATAPTRSRSATGVLAPYAGQRANPRTRRLSNVNLLAPRRISKAASGMGCCSIWHLPDHEQ